MSTHFVRLLLWLSLLVVSTTLSQATPIKQHRYLRTSHGVWTKRGSNTFQGPAIRGLLHRYHSRHKQRPNANWFSTTAGRYTHLLKAKWQARETYRVNTTALFKRLRESTGLFETRGSPLQEEENDDELDDAAEHDLDDMEPPTVIPTSREMGNDNEYMKSSDVGPGWEPFAVNISTARFFGGLITYSHELHPARICRVMNACVRQDGTLVLPAWMRRHDEMLSFDCGVMKLDFSQPDTRPPPPLRNLDLFGTDTSPNDVSSFLNHFMPQLVSLDMLSGERHLSRTCHTRRGRGCQDLMVLAEELRPAIALESEVSGRRTTGLAWIQQFVGLIPTERYAHSVRILNTSGIPFYNDDSLHQCFRSVVVTRGPRSKYAINSDLLQDLQVFKKNGLLKTPRNVREAHPGSFFIGSGVCSLNVTVASNYRIWNETTSGQIPGIDEISAAIREHVNSVAGLVLNVQKLDTSVQPSEIQRNAMQTTDILVAGHGSVLANMIFLRTNSTVVELMPFGYYPKTYEKLALYLADVRYDRYIAYPDLQGFARCVDNAHSDKAESAELVQQFQKAASRYKTMGSTHSLLFHKMGTSPRYAQDCARMQRLEVAPKRLAALVSRLAKARCGIPMAQRL